MAGNDEKAAETAKEAADFAPQSVTTLTNLWAAQMRLGKFANAYDTAGKLIQLGEQLPGKIRQLESLLLDSKHGRLLEESVQDAELANQLSQIGFYVAASYQSCSASFSTSLYSKQSSKWRYSQGRNGHGGRLCKNSGGIWRA